MTAHVLLGEQPWGGRDDRPVLTKAIPVEQRDRVLGECRRLLDTALAVAKLAGEDDVITAAKAAPIHPLAFEGAIRSYRDLTPGLEEYRANQRITPLDVLIHVGRVVDRLFVEVGVTREPIAGGFPTDGKRVRERISQLSHLLDGVEGNNDASYRSALCRMFLRFIRRGYAE